MKITDMDTAVEVLVNAIKTEYRDYTDRGAIARMKRDGGDGEYTDINKRMIEEFENGSRLCRRCAVLPIDRESSRASLSAGTSNQSGATTKHGRGNDPLPWPWPGHHGR